ncbi:MAG TPA: LPS assembly lipoprotein LptE [Alphaproteobacteria bacterium]|nr:LPS assembly lipoprotein LptE [Alphaproteobacteria bacterium]
MSSYSDFKNSSSCRIIAVLAMLSLSALPGCGFEPLNAKHETASSTIEQMSEVKIAPIQSTTDEEAPSATTAHVYRVNLARLGQQMRNELLNTFNPDGAPAAPLYELNVHLKVTETLVAQDSSGLAQTYWSTVTAIYDLRTVKDGKSVFSGSSNMTNDWAMIENSYSTVVQRQDAQRQAMRALAEDIARRTALYFKREAASAN